VKQYKILFEKRALRDLKRLNYDAQKRILSVLNIIKEEGFRLDIDIVKLKGYKNQYRIRVGPYRILFEFISANTIIIHAILPRKKAYK